MTLAKIMGPGSKGSGPIPRIVEKAFRAAPRYETVNQSHQIESPTPSLSHPNSGATAGVEGKSTGAGLRSGACPLPRRGGPLGAPGEIVLKFSFDFARKFYVGFQCDSLNLGSIYSLH